MVRRFLPVVFPLSAAPAGRDHFRGPIGIYIPAVISSALFASSGVERADEAEWVPERAGTDLDGRDGGAACGRKEGLGETVGRRKTAGRAFAKGLAKQFEWVLVPGWALQQVRLQAQREAVRLRVRREGPSEGYSSGKRDQGSPNRSGLSDTYSSRSETAIKSQFQASQNCLNMSAFKIPSRWRAFWRGEFWG